MFIRFLKKVEKIMNIGRIGALINYERTKQNISIDKLRAGVCSEAVLRRIEAGERGADFFVLERLISRLGNSSNKVELIQDEKDYELLILREKLNGKLGTKNYDEAEKLLIEYKKIADKGNNLQLQYTETIEGILCSEKYIDYNKANEHFYKAINLTLPKFSLDKLGEYLFGENEIVLLLLYLKNNEEIGENSLSVYSNTILSYIDRYFTDEEVKCNLYGRVAWVIGDSFIKNNKYEEALQVTMKAEDVLVNNGLLLNVPQLLDRILFLSENINKILYEDFKKMRDALKDLYEEYGFEWNTEDINLLLGYKQRNINVISEMVKRERLIRGISQQKLAEDLEIDIKTISRIECGKVLPKRNTLQKILDYFEIESEVAESRIITNDFHLLEMEREIAKLNTFQRYEEAEALYKDLKPKISLDYNKNKQYVKLMDTQFDRIMKRCKPDEAIVRLTEAFNITRGDIGIDGMGEFVLSKMEAVITNDIAICYKEMEYRNKSIELLERVIQSYESSRVDLKHRYVPLVLVYTNLCRYYEETDQFEKAIEFADKAIRYSIECIRGDFLGFLLEERTYAIDRMIDKNTESKLKYKQSYQIRKLMKASERQKAPLKKAFLKWYGEEIE